MKQVLGWYNIQDLNKQIVGQIKIGILPSATFSTPKSTKYFRNNQPMSHINLTTNLPNPMKSVIPKQNSEASPKVFFQQLNTQLQDLQELTTRIQQRVYNTPRYSQTSQDDTTHKDSSNMMMEITKTAHDNDDVNTKESSRNDTSTNNLHQDKNRIDLNLIAAEEENSVSNLGEENKSMVDNSSDLEASLVKNIFNPDIEQSPESKETTNADIEQFPESKETTNNIEDDNCSPHSKARYQEYHEETKETDVNNIADDAVSSCDSTDELLEDLKMFEKKFTFLKGTLEKDNDYEGDSWISDTEIIDINLMKHEINSSDKPQFDTVEKKDDVHCVTSSITTKCCDVILEEKGDIDFQIEGIIDDDDLVVNVSSTSYPSKEEEIDSCVGNHVSDEAITLMNLPNEFEKDITLMNSPNGFKEDITLKNGFTEDITNFDNPKQTSECFQGNQDILSEQGEKNMEPTLLEGLRGLNISHEEIGCSSNTEIKPADIPQYLFLISCFLILLCFTKMQDCGKVGWCVQDELYRLSIAF